MITIGYGERSETLAENEWEGVFLRAGGLLGCKRPELHIPTRIRGMRRYHGL